MKINRCTLSVAMTAFGLGSFGISSAPAWAAGMPVFDAANYAQNLLESARALDQINNQVKSLQNEASMIEGMTKNLKTIDFPELQNLNSEMLRIDQLMNEAKGVDFKIDGLEQRIEALFPGDAQALTADRRVADAKTRLDASRSAYLQSMEVQAEVAENVEEDSGALNGLIGRSQSAAGALQASQAANQLLALGVKQQFQLQNLLASEFREASIERARRAQAEEDGRATTLRFLGGEAKRGN